MAQRYYFLRPSAFNLRGFAYGSTDGDVTQVTVTVHLVCSGRWAEQQEQSVELRQDELTPREVSEEEALNGVGTTLWSTICTAKTRSDGCRVWTYGLVLGYKWEANEQQGWLDVNFDGTPVSVEYYEGSTRHVPVEVYALQPCRDQSTSLIMAAEMKQRHTEVYNNFHGINQIATRDSKVLLSNVGADEIDESQTVPLLNTTNSMVLLVPVRHILDYVYYKEGYRPHPSGKTFGDTIFANIGDTPTGIDELPKPVANAYPVPVGRLGSGFPPKDSSTDGELFIYERWETGVCGCYTHMVPNCCMVTCCPCISLAQIWARLGITPYWVALLLHSAAYGILWIGVFSGVQWNWAPAMTLVIIFNVSVARHNARKRYRILGVRWLDFLISCCCNCCVIAQIATHIKSYRPGSCDFGPRNTLPPYPLGSNIQPAR
ncbi:hypothetical protein PHMEG_00016587 [Phytophthora megakarya]|uniref:Transmembrane protein n=1 Tax=Phytophthora megakarya TaxID=4795 RepID=A0A225VYX4_9STRA|nr:hypothetical protein PHMEG_00016587 [Phytophthora megakarya]